MLSNRKFIIAKTKPQYFKFQGQWEVEFNELDKGSACCDLIISSNFPNLELTLKYYNDISISLKYSGENYSSIIFKSQIEIRCGNKSYIESHNRESLTYSDGLYSSSYCKCVFTEKIPEEDLPLIEDKLIVIYEILVKDEYLHEMNEKEITNSLSGKQFYEDFGSLLKNETFSDVTFKISDCEVKAHKNILAARSPVFKAMFSHDMNENNSNYVTVSDIDVHVFKDMLNFIYTSQLTNLKERAMELLIAADKYDLENLKSTCIEEIRKNLSVEKAIPALIVADRHEQKKLKIEIIEFINRHKIEIKQSSTWKELSDANLLKEIVASWN